MLKSFSHWTALILYFSTKQLWPRSTFYLFVELRLWLITSGDAQLLRRENLDSDLGLTNPTAPHISGYQTDFSCISVCAEGGATRKKVWFLCLAFQFSGCAGHFQNWLHLFSNCQGFPSPVRNVPNWKLVFVNSMETVFYLHQDFPVAQKSPRIQTRC